MEDKYLTEYIHLRKIIETFIIASIINHYPNMKETYFIYNEKIIIIETIIIASIIILI